MIKTLLSSLVFATFATTAFAQWSLSNTGISSSDNLKCVHFPTATTGYSGGVYCFYKTTNGGANWNDALSSIPQAYRSVSGIHFLNKDTGFICGWSGLNSNNSPTNGFILKTVNGGTSWTAVKSSLAGPIFSVKFTSATTGFAAGGASDGASGLYSTTDGGNTWATVSSLSNLNVDLFDMTVTPGNTVLMCGMLKRSSFDFREIMFRKVAGSNTVDTMTFDSPDYCTEYLSIQALDNSNVFALGNKCFARSVNGGISWYTGTITSNVAYGSFSSVFFTSALVGWANGNYGDLYHTTDGGNSWTKVTLPTSPAFSSMFFKSPAQGYSVGSAGVVYKYSGSTNGIDPVNTSSQISVYPVPSSNRINFEGINSSYSAMIAGITGKVIKQQKVDGNNAGIDCSDLVPGIYFVLLTDAANGIVFKGKIVISR